MLGTGAGKPVTKFTSTYLHTPVWSVIVHKFFVCLEKKPKAVRYSPSCIVRGLFDGARFCRIFSFFTVAVASVLVNQAPQSCA